VTRLALLVILVGCGGPAKPAQGPVGNATPPAQPTQPAANVDHDARGVELAGQGKVDEAAAEYIAELKLAATKPTVFEHLDAIYKQLSPARKKEIALLGTTQELPIKVPEIGFEYGWVAHFGCADGEGKVESQALMAGKRQLDLLNYKCPDGSDHGAYFDFSDDPTEKAMRQELEGKKP
jgi:hypothetical protein